MTDIPAASDAVPAKIGTGFSLRRFLGWLHLWTGIIFCIPLVALGVSGSILMIEHETPNRFVEDRASATYKPVAAIIEAAKAAAPEGRVAVNYDAPAKTGAPAYVRFVAPPRGGEGAQQGQPRPGAGTRIAVDPVSLEARVDQGPGPGGAAGGFIFERFMHDLHGRMLIEGLQGRQVVGWLGVFMCVLGLSGIVMWWPKPGQWKNAFRIRFGQSALRVNRQTHGAVGIWFLIVLLIVSFSGVYIVFPQTINGAVGASPAIRDMRNQQPFAVTPIADTTPIDADAAAGLANEAVPGGIVRAIALPANEMQPYRVTLSRVGDFNGKPRALVIVDPWQNKVIEVRDPETYAPIDKFLAFQRQMHAGNALGWWWWIPVLLSGLLPPLFVGTGITMYLLKRRNKRRVVGQL